MVVKRNESAWNYLRVKNYYGHYLICLCHITPADQGVLEHCEDAGTAAAQRQEVTAKCEELLQTGCDSPYLLGFLVELYRARLEDGGASDQTDLVRKISDLCGKLSGEVDIVRAKYWTFVSDCVTKKHAVVA